MTDFLALPRFALPAAGRRALRRIDALLRETGALASDPAGAVRLAGLAHTLAELQAGRAGGDPELAGVIASFPQPREAAALAAALIQSRRRQASAERFADYGALAQHLRRAANPYGRLWLQAAGVADPRAAAFSDGLCSALALVELLLDIPADARAGALRLPLDELVRFRVTEAAVARGTPEPGWQALMTLQIERARRLLQAGAPLAGRLRGRQRLAVRIAVIRAEVVLRKLHRARGDVFRVSAGVTAADWAYLAYRVAFGR
ncbi:MAG: phytoene/squalene synthase family protein [Pseudomonadota bacterium]